MKQGSLFEIKKEQGQVASIKPAARRTDPATSHEAAAKHESSGKAATNREAVLDMVKIEPGQTGAEYGVLTGLGQHECVRRLGELVKSGDIKRGDARKCGIKKTNQTTWWLTEAEAPR